MREITGDLFDHPSDAIVIPVNWRTNRQGHAIMGAGVAKQAAKRWPWLPRSLGQFIDQTPDAPRIICLQTAMHGYLLSFPTKRDWRDSSDVDLIGQGALTLVDAANSYGWQTITLPRLGCGLGGLSWEVQVRPLLAELLDDRFVVVHPEGR